MDKGNDWKRRRNGSKNGNNEPDFYKYGIYYKYSNKSYGYTLQLFNRWDSTDPTNQFILTRYAANGTVNKQALSETSGATYMSIVSVSGGTVKVKSATNSNWVDLSLTWYAW